MVSAVEKTDLIFSFLLEHPEGATLNEVSTSRDIPKSTTHRLLTSLALLDYIEHDRHGGRYYLEALSETTEETVKLSIIRHEKDYVINAIESPRIMKFTMESLPRSASPLSRL